MGVLAKRELLVQVSARYRGTSDLQKRVILDEFVAATGYARKYAIRLLGNPDITLTTTPRLRKRRYGKDVEVALVVAWAAANYICAKRLIPFLPELIPILEAHGHLTVGNDVRDQLLTMSPATADRMLGQYRRRDTPRGIGTTRPGILLKHQVPIRTFADWTDTRSGFVEADLVAHCGSSAEGPFLYSLVVTDVSTGWIECYPLLYRTQEAVVQALELIRSRLPMPMLGLDTDNGSEFLNRELIAYCEREQLTFTRGRAYKKNDQCFVEQKNGSVVRQLVGYDRFEGESAYRQLGELYKAVRLYVNFFQPSMKLLDKNLDGCKVSKKYDIAQTPYHRLLRAGVLDERSLGRLNDIHSALDPVSLLQRLRVLQDALWKHAIVVRLPSGSSIVSRDPSVAMATERFYPDIDRRTLVDAPSSDGTLDLQRHRKYRHAVTVRKPMGPRTWRTRVNPFESVWDEIVAILEQRPEMTAKYIFHELQQQHPGEFPDAQLRTLQRRVKEWRFRALIQFNDGWLAAADIVSTQTIPWSLRAMTGAGI
jgi:hypothetical protein